MQHTIRKLCFSRLVTVSDNRYGTGRDCFDLFGGERNEDGTGLDGKMTTEQVVETGRDGQWVYNFSTGRDGKNQRDFFAPRDGSVNIFFRDGTGRLMQFFTAGRDGKCNFLPRDGTEVPWDLFCLSQT